jgi:hypothetical protein
MTESIFDLEYRLLGNFIEHMPKTYRLRNVNWVIVKDFLQSGTSKAGSTSSIAKCRELGIDPYGYTLCKEEEIKMDYEPISMDTLKNKNYTIKTIEDALKDVEPMEWGIEVK